MMSSWKLPLEIGMIHCCFSFNKYHTYSIYSIYYFTQLANKMP